MVTDCGHQVAQFVTNFPRRLAWQGQAKGGARSERSHSARGGRIERRRLTTGRRRLTMGGGMEIRKGVVREYDAGSHEADVQIIGSMATVVTNVPVADSAAGTVAVGKDCLVVFFRGDPGLLVCTWGEAE